MRTASQFAPEASTTVQGMQVELDLFGSDQDRALNIVRSSPEHFPQEFETWLVTSWPVWKAFERRAHRLWDSGARHAGARMIGEHIRYLTALRQGDITYKVNNSAWPSCARLYMALHPSRRLFETRSSTMRIACD